MSYSEAENVSFSLFKKKKKACEELAKDPTLALTFGAG